MHRKMPHSCTSNAHTPRGDGEMEEGRKGRKRERVGGCLYVYMWEGKVVHVGYLRLLPYSCLVTWETEWKTGKKRKRKDGGRWRKRVHPPSMGFTNGDIRSLYITLMRVDKFIKIKKQTGIHTINIPCVTTWLEGERTGYYQASTITTKWFCRSRQKAEIPQIGLDIQAYLMRRQCCGKQRKPPVEWHRNPAVRIARSPQMTPQNSVPAVLRLTTAPSSCSRVVHTVRDQNQRTAED